MNNKHWIVLFVVVLFVTTTISKPVVPVIVPIIGAIAGAAGAGAGAAGVGISASGCKNNCFLNDWKARDATCSSGKYSYNGPVHGKCYCCR